MKYPNSGTQQQIDVFFFWCYLTQNLFLIFYIKCGQALSYILIYM